MDLSSMVNQKLVQFEYQAASKDEVIRSVGQMMAEAGIVNDKEKYIEAVFKRETECATGIGMGVAIPHCKSDAVNDAAFALIKLKNPIEWGSLDGEPVKFVIQLAAPDSDAKTRTVPKCRQKRSVPNCRIRSMTTPQVKDGRAGRI